MTRVALGAILSHWRRNPLQLFTLLAGLALATALWSGVQAVNAEARASYDAAADTLGEGQFDRLLRRDGGAISQANYVAMRRAGWLVSPVIDGQRDGIRLVGVEALTAPGQFAALPLQMDLNQFLGPQGAIVAGADATERLQDWPVTIIISDTAAPMTAVGDIGTVQRLLGRVGDIDALVVAPDQPLIQVALADVAPDLVRQVAQGGSDLARLTDSFHLNLTAFGLLSFAVGIFIVHGAIGLAFEQRRPMIRTLRALGVPLRQMVVIMAGELALLALVAGAVGVALGYVIAALLLPDVAATLRGLYGANVSGTLQLRPIWWLSGLAIALGGTAVAGAGALRQLAQMPVLAGAGARAMAMQAGLRAHKLAVIAVLLLGASGVLTLTAQGLIAGFALLGSLLIGAALALPYLLDLALALGQRLARGVLAQWFWADTRQQLPGLSLALMALLLALSANIGVSTMVSSFRLTFVAFLDQRLASEIYVTIDHPEDAPALVAFLSDKTDAVLPIRSAPAQIAGFPADVYGVVDHATYRQNWAFLDATPNAWDQLFAGQGIIISEQLARRGGIWVGDTVPLADRNFAVVGVYGDYGNPIGQAMLADTVFAQLYPDVTALRYGLRLPQGDVGALRENLAENYGLRPDQMIDQAAIKAFSLGVFERTFTVTAALNVLTMSVAGFAMLMSLLTLAEMRVPQLAPPWAMGVTRASLGRFELLRAALLAGLVAVMALPLGLALAWALLVIVNVAAFGWQLPMHLFWVDYARLMLLALVAAGLAALWPARRLATTPTSALLKVFSNER